MISGQETGNSVMSSDVENGNNVQLNLYHDWQSG